MKKTLDEVLASIPNAPEPALQGRSLDDVLSRIPNASPDQKNPAAIEAKSGPYSGSDPNPAPFDLEGHLKKIDPMILSSAMAGGDPLLARSDPYPVADMIKPWTRPWQAIGYSAAEALNRGLAHFSTNLDTLMDYMAEKSGTSKDDLFRGFAQKYEENSEYWKKKAEENGVNFVEELLGTAVGGAVPGIAEFMLNVPYASLLGAANAKKTGGNELGGALVEGAKRGILGAVFKVIHPLRQYLRAPMMGGIFGFQAATEGGDARDVAKAIGTGAIYSAFSPGGRYGLNELAKNGRSYLEAAAEKSRETKAFAAKETYRDFLDARQESGVMGATRQAEKEMLVDAFNRFPLGRTIETELGEQIRFNPPEAMAPEQYVHYFLTKYSKEKNVEEYSARYLRLAGEIEETVLSYDSRILGENNGQDRIYYVREFQPDAKSPHHVLVVAVDGEGNFRGWTHFEAKEGYKKKLQDAEQALVESRGLVDRAGKRVEMNYAGYLEEGRRTPLYLGSGAGSALRRPQEPPSIARENIAPSDRDVKENLQDGSPAAISMTPRDADMAPANEPASRLVPPDSANFLTDIEPPTLSFAPRADFRRMPEGGGGADAAPMGRSEIRAFLEEKLDIPIRTGRFRVKDALGIYKPKEEIVRTRFANDIETISHEVGHALQKFLWPETMSKSGLNAIPFKEFRDELTPLATRPRAGQAVEPEGFAEFVRLYITDAAKAQAQAPRFYDHFETLLDQKTPESKAIFLEARRRYDQYMKQPALQRVLSQISIGAKEARATTVNDLFTKWIDDLHPLELIVKKMAGGESLPASRDPYTLARLFKGWQGKAETFLKHQPFRFGDYADIPGVKAMRDILDPVRDNLGAFRAYVVSRRARELADRGIETGLIRKDIDEVIADYDAQFSKAFEELKAFQDASLQYLRDSGILDAKTYAEIKQLNDDYVPFYRVMDDQKNAYGTGRGLQARDPIKRIKGSWRDIVDPLESIVKNTFLYLNLAEKNAVGKALVDLARSREGLGRYVDKIPTPQKGVTVSPEEISRYLQELGRDLDLDLSAASPDMLESMTVFRPSSFVPRDNVIVVWEKGKRNLYEVHPEISRVFQALDKEQMHTLFKILSYPASWLRAGATLTPEFIARNPIRDQWSAFINSKYGYVPGFDLARGIFSMVKRDDLYWQFKKAGADHSMLVSMDRDYLQDSLGDLLQKYPLANAVKNPVNALRMLSEVAEMGSRIGEFRRGLEKEGADKEGMQKAGLAAREITLDFSRSGSAVRGALNAISAFTNAQIQDMNKIHRQFKDDPVGTSIRAAAAITLPSILLAVANHDDPRYKEIAQWQKDLFWIVIPNRMSSAQWEAMTPEEKAAEIKWLNGSVWRIPKPFAMGILFGSVPERIVGYIMDQDPKAFDGLLASFGRAFGMNVVPTAFIAPMENWANKSWFFDRAIVPRGLEDVQPEYQYGEHTSETAKALGKVIGRLPAIGETGAASPAYIDNLVRGWTGGLGRYVMEILGAGLEAAGLVDEKADKPARTLADMPIIKGFLVRYPSSGAASIERFYERYEKAEKANKAVKLALERDQNAEIAMKIWQESGMADMSGIHRAMGSVRKSIQLIERSKEMTADEKREAIDILYLQMIDMAKQGNRLYEQFQKAREMTP